MSIFTRMPAAQIALIAGDIFNSAEPAIRIGLDNARAAAENVGREHAPMAHKTAVDNLVAAIYWHNQLAKGEPYSPLDFTAIVDRLAGLVWSGLTPDMEQGRYIVLSTAHIEPETADLLHEEATDTLGLNGLPMGVYSGQFGYWVSLYRDDESGNPLAARTEALPDLVACMDYAWAAGFQYIFFDGDAPEIAALPTYEWE